MIKTITKEEKAESIQLVKSKELLFTFDHPIIVPEGYSLEITYSFSVLDNAPLEDVEYFLSDWEKNSNVVISFSENQDSWILPVTLETLGLNHVTSLQKNISYTIPLHAGKIESFSVHVTTNNSHEKIFLDLQSFRLVPRWFGIVEKSDLLLITPFTYVDSVNNVTAVNINLPEKYRFDFPELNTQKFYNDHSRNKKNQHYSFPVDNVHVDFIVLQSSKNRAFPLEPISLSPADVIYFKKDDWRRANFEVFRWNEFPSILIFDTSDYEVQDKLLKRLAFFVEKAGFQGSLSTDEEIAHLHGWNAHDYRAEDLARFFETARITNFPLNTEELELKEILLEQKIILQDKDNNITAGNGAIVSISQESLEYLRHLFMVHEYFHGLYFIDKEFEDFSRTRWENLHPAAKRFLSEYFASQRYDTNNEYLMANELMAYCLQQPVNNAADYFGKTLAGRIDANPLRRNALPAKDNVSESWPILSELFTKEANAFSEYVTTRWNLRAGSMRVR
jgi:hypothetical protein